MKITICGSMSHAKTMISIQQELESKNHSVVLPANVESYADGSIAIENKIEKMKLNVIKHYFEEIKQSDAILVINKDKNNIANYIGGNSLIEMAFAHVLGKKIFLLHEIPQMSYSDEIETMQPIILHGNLSAIK